MRSRDEFEALVLRKLEAKRSGAVRTRRAWESVAATAAACFLMVLTAYLVVPDGFGAPVVTVTPVVTVDGETTVPETMSEEEITLRALADAALAEKYGIFDFSTFDIYGVMHDDEATFNYTFQFDGYRTDERYTVSLTYEGVILKITDEEAGLYTEGRIFDRFAKVDVERALASLAEQRRPYAHIKNHACEMTVSSNKLQLYVEIIEDIDPPETEIYDGTVFDSGCGKDHRHIMFRETVTAIGDVDSVTTEAPETTAPETTAPPLFEDEEEKLAFYSDPSMSLEALREGLVKTQCPADLLPTAVKSLNDSEILSLMPYFEDMTVREILSLEPFCSPEQIDLGWLLYCQSEQAELADGEYERVLNLFWGDWTDEDDVEAFWQGNKLTTSDYEAILRDYLDAKLTPYLLQWLRKETSYLPEYDAYYSFHTDYNVAPLVILQGWQTEEGGYLIRFRQEDSFNGDFTVWLQPVGDRYRIKQLLCLGEPISEKTGEALEEIDRIVGENNKGKAPKERVEDIYQAYLSLPLESKVRMAEDGESPNFRLTLRYKNSSTEDIWLEEDLIRIGDVWYKPEREAYRSLLELVDEAFQTETESSDATAPDTTAPESDDSSVIDGEEVAFYPDHALSLDALNEGIRKTGCPDELCPTGVRELNDLELLGLFPYLRDPTVREILFLDPFYTHEQIDFGRLLYCQIESAELTEEEKAFLFAEDDYAIRYKVGKLTTDEIIAIPKTYLGTTLTPRVLQTLWFEQYFDEYDAYYGLSTEDNVTPLVVLQGFQDADGDYLIRFSAGGKAGGDHVVRLSPEGNGYVIKQLLRLGEAIRGKEGEVLDAVYIGGLPYNGEEVDELYQAYLSLPLVKREGALDPDIPFIGMSFEYKSSVGEEIWLAPSNIGIDGRWYEPDGEAYGQLLERLGLSFEDFEEDTTEGTSCSHEYRVTAERETSCRQDGYRIYTCLLCSHNRSETIPALEHDYQRSDSLDSDCRKQGYDTYTCTVCHGSYTEDRPFASHTYADGYCTVCGEPQASEGLTYSLNADGASYTVTGMGTCTDTVVVIPARYQAYPVTRIGDRAFKDQTAVTAFGLPTSLREIDELAFSGCIGITEMVIPEGVTTLRYGALHCCDNLTELNLPSTLTEIEKDFYYSESGKLLAIPVAPDNPRYVFRDGALYDNGGTVLLQYAIGRKDETFTVPQGVTAIAFGAFRNAGLLQKVILPEGVTEIGNSAFEGCASLADISLPLSLVRIEGYAFDRCYALKTLYEGNSLKNHKVLTEIGEGAFKSCESLKTIRLPDGVTEIAGNTFAYCKALTTIELPSSVTIVGEYAFFRCGLGKIKLPSSVTSVGGKAFAECPNLTLARIPKSVTTMGYKVFDGCRALTKIYCAAPSCPTGWQPSWNSGTDAVVSWNVT